MRKRYKINKGESQYHEVLDLDEFWYGYDGKPILRAEPEMAKRLCGLLNAEEKVNGMLANIQAKRKKPEAAK